MIEVFKTAEEFQAKQDTDTYVSVVVLDEVGLAEDSPNLPLKALHPLLEDGTEGAGKNYQQRVCLHSNLLLYVVTSLQHPLLLSNTYLTKLLHDYNFLRLWSVTKE